MPDAFTLVESAILNWQRNPEVEVASLAAALGVSTSVLSRAFRRCAGIAPKRFQQVLAVERARLALRRCSVLGAALESGASGPGRLHDRCLLVDALTPGELRSGGRGLTLSWGCAATHLGPASISWSGRGIHRLTFGEAGSRGLNPGCPHATLVRKDDDARALLGRVFSDKPGPFRVAVVGSAFQVAVWRALLSIPLGATATYSALAARIGRPGAVRAVGTACGANPVAILVPCHRVIQASGALGGFRWGLPMKACLLARELSGQAFPH